MSELEPTELESAIASLPEGTIKYEATFVPYKKVSEERKKSWGAGANGKPNFFLTWTVTINGESFEYSAGIGHISNAALAKISGKLGWTVRERDEIEAWVNGTVLSATGSFYFKPTVPQKPPALADVLFSLLAELDSLDYSFEEWADNYGYDHDSRTAEKTYNQCRDQSYRTLRALGAETVEKLRGLEH